MPPWVGLTWRVAPADGSTGGKREISTHRQIAPSCFTGTSAVVKSVKGTAVPLSCFGGILGHREQTYSFDCSALYQGSCNLLEDPVRRCP